MHTEIMHWGRKWKRPNNHFDGRVCPKCATTVHGSHAQHKHQQWHLDLQEVISELSSRPPVDDEPMPWVAAVDELEAAE